MNLCSLCSSYWMQIGKDCSSWADITPTMMAQILQLLHQPPEVMCSLCLFALHSAAWFNHTLGHSELLALSASVHQEVKHRKGQERTLL